MLKSFIATIFALLVATFGVHQAAVATSLPLSPPSAHTQPAQLAAGAASTQQTATSTTPYIQDLSSQGIPTPGIGTHASAADTPHASTPVVLQQPNTTDLNSKLDQLTAVVGNIVSLLPVLSGSNQQQAAAYIPLGDGAPNTIAAASNIGQLANVTVDGISGLTAGEIPALNYLPSTGGSVSGSLAVVGTTTLASSVTTTGSNLITNGNFNGSAAGWNHGSTAGYGANDIISTYGPVLGASLDGGVDDSGDASTTFQTVSGDTYLLTFTVSSATGSLWVYLTHDTLASGLGMQGPFGNGTHTVAFQTNFTGTETITFSYWDGAPWYDMSFGNAAGETWTLSNVSIKQATSITPAIKVTGYDGSTWLSLGNDVGGDTALGQNALSSDLNNSASYYNTAIGANALYNSTTGGENAAVGWDALYSNTTGTFNVALGPDALFKNTTGGTNAAIGLWTLYNNTTGYDNTGEGGFALFSNTTGAYNTAGGLYALSRNTTGSNNVAYGLQALNYNTSATNTVAVGAEAAAGTGRYYNQGGTVVGYQAGYDFATSSDYNTLLGYQAGYGITTGNNNIWIGTATSSTAVANLTTGSQNILIGNNVSFPSATASGQLDIGNIIYGTGITGTGSTLSSGKIGIGTAAPGATLDVESSAAPLMNLISTTTYAQFQITSYRNSATTHSLIEGLAARGTKAAPSAILSGDTLLSIRAGGYGTTDFDSNIKDDAAAIEFQADQNFSDSGGTPQHGARIVFETANASSYDIERMRITSLGNVGIGTASPYSRLQVTGSDTASTSAFAVVNSASTTEFSVYDTGNAVLSGGLTQNSDQRLKTNIQTIDASTSLAAIDALNPVSFDWINGIFGGGEQLGFIAQAVQQVFPQLVSTTSPTALTPDGTLGLNYSGLIAPIIASIQGIAHISGDFETNLISWFGNADNGINDLFANNVYATSGNFTTLTASSTVSDTISTHQITADELCAGSVCVNQQQLAGILAGQSGAAQSAGQGSASEGGSSSAEASSTPDMPPVIQINGDNPAIINVGAAYNDLGASVTGPQADLNLGIVTFVNGVLTSPVVIDTSAAATDTIDYVATDQNGLAATSTRMVIVQATTTTIQ